MFRLTVKPGQAYPHPPPQIPSVGSCRLQIHLCILACAMSREFTREAVPEFDIVAFHTTSLKFKLQTKILLSRCIRAAGN